MLYIITGPAGVGKSTVANKIAELSNKCAWIEGDDVYHLVKGGYVSPWKEGNHLDIFWKNSISLIKNFLDNNYDVVFNYIIKKDDLIRLQKEFENQKIKFVLLIADEDTLISRDKERNIDSQMGERVLVLLKELLAEDYDKKYILDTTDLSIDKTVNTIINNDNFLC